MRKIDHGLDFGEGSSFNSVSGSLGAHSLNNIYQTPPGSGTVLVTREVRWTSSPPSNKMPGQHVETGTGD